MTGDGGDGSDVLAAVEAVEPTLRSALAEALRSAVDADDAVASSLREWEERGAPSLVSGGDTAIQRVAARQASVLTNHVRYRAAVGRDVPTTLGSTPVTPFAGLDVPPSVENALESLESRLADAPDVPPDLLGARYADALSDDERRVRGQFYTPPSVAALVTRWALGDAESGSDEGNDHDDPPRVLDPAAGTGAFPLAAYDRLRERFPGADPDSLLSRLVAVDVDEVALHLAALRLSARSGGRPVEAFDRRVGSFFDLEPGLGRDGDGTHDGNVPLVDAVVGNPPFVRAGDLSPDRAHFRDHLDAFGPDGETGGGNGGSRYADGDAALSRRSDAYVYFLTHATRFLRPGGRLGVVLPAKWLESDYGAGFRRFLADQYRVHAVVGFGARAFDALVDTVLLLAERRERRGSDGAVGIGAPDVRFVKLEEPLGSSSATTPSLADLLGHDEPNAPTVTRDGRARVVRRSQSTFATARTCSPYLRAPEALLPLLDHPAFVRLGDLASVSRGVTTGANRFFLVDDDERERWGIDPELLRPAVRSIRGVESRSVSADDADLSVIDVHGFLSERLDEDGTSEAATGSDGAADPTQRAKAALRDAGHDGLVDYVEHAEAERCHEGRTCQSRRVWFDLGVLPTPDAFVPKLLRERVFTVRNEAGAVPTNAIDCLSVREGVDPEVLLGVLDSSLSKALMEVWGRNEAGMLQLMTYETRTLPVPDVREFSPDGAAAVREAAAGLDADGDGQNADEGSPGADRDGQAELDAAVHAAVDVDLPAERARAMRERLLGRRIDGGDRVEVPVSGD